MRADLPRAHIGEHIIFTLSGSTYMATVVTARIVGPSWHYGVIIDPKQDLVFVHENELKYAWKNESWTSLG